MMKKGLVVKINANDAVVMNENGQYESIVLRDQMQVGMRLLYSSEDVLQMPKYRRIFEMNTKNKILAASAALAIIVFGAFGFQQFSPDTIPAEIVENPAKLVSAIVTVDINPSFKIEVDAQNRVLTVTPQNDDAKTIVITDLVGIDVETAIELIVIRSHEAGFLNYEDLDDDYVLIAAANVEDDDALEDQAEKILKAIQEKALDSAALKEVNLAMTKLDDDDMEKAEKEALIAALMNLSGSNGLTVQEFFANEDNLAKFLQNGTIIPQDLESKIALMSSYLETVEGDDIDKESLDAAFRAAKDSFSESKEKYQAALKAYQEAKETGDQAKIDAAKAVLDAAEIYKNQMEAAKDDVESIKEVLKSALEGKDDDDDDKDDDDKDDDSKDEEERLKESIERASEELKREEERASEEQKREDEKASEEQKREEEKASESESESDDDDDDDNDDDDDDDDN